MIAFFELHPEEHFVNVCVRAFMTVMNDRLIQVRSRLFFRKFFTVFRNCGASYSLDQCSWTDRAGKH